MSYDEFDEDGTVEGDFDDDDFDDESLDESDDEYPTLPCPHCGAEVLEDVPQCPYCGAYITHSTSVFQGKPLWWVVLGLLGIGAVILALGGLAWLGG